MNNIIVVEGIHDESKIKEVYPDISCVVTNGSEISKDTINLIKELSKNNKIIIFTDPDHPGEKIRNIIEENIKDVSHAFLRSNICRSKNGKKVGIEHASSEAIIDALSNVITKINKEDTITNIELYSLGLNGNDNSRILRDKISDHLNIGRPNAKTFLKRLNLLGLTKDDLINIIEKEI